MGLCACLSPLTGSLVPAHSGLSLVGLTGSPLGQLRRSPWEAAQRGGAAFVAGPPAGNIQALEPCGHILCLASEVALGGDVWPWETQKLP